jgi:hypothetical protein
VETNVASSGHVVLYTANWNDAFSFDGGQHFAELDPYHFMSNLPGGFCCDQVVQYAPKIDRFVWVLLSNPDQTTGESVICIAFASPASMEANQATVWNYYDLTAEQLNLRGHSFDYPEIAIGDSYLYMSFWIPASGTGVMVRIPLGNFLASAAGTAAPAEFITIPNASYVRPVQNAGAEGIFAWEPSTSELGLVGWSGNSVRMGKVDIFTIPTENRCSIVPGGTDNSCDGPQDWLATSPRHQTKWSTHIYGAVKTSDQIWLAWNAARDYRDAQGNIIHAFSQPHIETATIDATNFQLIGQFGIFNDDFAYAYPCLRRIRWDKWASYLRRAVGQSRYSPG